MAGGFRPTEPEGRWVLAHNRHGLGPKPTARSRGGPKPTADGWRGATAPDGTIASVKPALAPYRLGAQRLVGEQLQSPVDVVGHLGAVQSQLHDMALWAIARRCGATLADIQGAFARGDFLRTHVLRPTWHHVLPSDLGDMIEVTAPRIRQLMASGNNYLGLTPERIERAAHIACETVEQADEPMTRTELDAVLTDAGYPRVDNSLAHILIHAELTGRIASGPVRGKQHTYIPIALPQSGRNPDERLAWIARLYGRGHGPFRDRDLAWWTSLTLTQSRRAVQLAELRPVKLAGQTYFVDEEPSTVDVPRAMLLANFDEFISYARDPDDFTGIGERDWSMLMRSAGLLFVDGQLAGSWTRKLSSTTASLDVVTARRVPAAVRAEIEADAGRFGAFVERPIDVELRVDDSVAHK